MKLWRINIILAFFFVLGAAMLAKLAYLQIYKNAYYKALAKGQQEIFESLPQERGEIFFRDKDKFIPIATQKDWYFCYASPQEIKNKEETAHILAQGLGINEKDFLKKLENSKSLFLPVKKSLNDDEINYLKEKKLLGVYIKNERGRFYPYNKLASDVLGFTDAEGKGQYGIEGYFNEILSGKESIVQKKFNPFGYFIRNELKLGSGADVYLTIDKNLQTQGEKLLQKAKENFSIEGGQIIILEPHSGKILALADFPAYNPNEYKSHKIDIFKNQAMQALFEPGSIFKVITMAAALNEKKITPDTAYKDEGFIKIGGRVLKNYGKRIWGNQTMTEVLEKSINTGAVFAEAQIGHKIFLEYIENFGIFEKTGIELSGEIFSVNTNLKKGYEVNYATASFGQGIDTTPLNFARAFSALANGGTLMRSYIVEEIRNEDQTEKTVPKKIRENIISQETINDITKMLVQVVENGFSKKARIPGYYIAGKTGTAQIPYSSLDIQKSGYSEKTWQSFIGYFPAYEPNFLILIKLDNPQTKTAEYSAVPLFNELARYIINYYQIPPDYE